MYQDFYGLSRAPFGLTPDPAFFEPAPSQQEALAAILYGVEQRKGIVALVGEVGLGKTTILRAYLERLDRTRCRAIYVLNPVVSFADLLDTILGGLDVPGPWGDVSQRVTRLHETLIAHYQAGRNVVVVVDEAQNMPVDTLENLRLLSNLETTTDKLLQVVLVGQPELAETLARPSLRQLRQRIAVRCRIEPLTATESEACIDARLRRVGGSAASIFTRGALRRIVGYSGGVPRTLNVVCDNALVTGFGYQQRPVTARIVDEVVADLEGRAPARAKARRWLVAASVLLTVVFGGGGVAVLAGAAPWPDRIVADPADFSTLVLPSPARPAGPFLAAAEPRPVPMPEPEALDAALVETAAVNAAQGAEVRR